MMWELFYSFLKIGLLSFGGGYAVIPMIQHEALAGGWLSDEQFQEVVAIAGMAPGPIATNSATLIGYHTAGIGGAIVSTLGMILPSLVLIIIISAFFFRAKNSKWMKSSFYGLRPIVTGLILYAAIHFGFMGKEQSFFTWQTIATLLISAAALFGIVKYKLHPIAIIVASGLLGIALF